MDDNYVKLASYVLENEQSLKKLNIEELEEIEEALMRGKDYYDNKGD